MIDVVAGTFLLVMVVLGSVWWEIKGRDDEEPAGSYWMRELDKKGNPVNALYDKSGNKIRVEVPKFDGRFRYNGADLAFMKTWANTNDPHEAVEAFIKAAIDSQRDPNELLAEMRSQQV